MSFNDARYPLFQTPTSFPPATNKKLNVVVLVLEGWPAKYVGALNNGQGYTPHFDRLASQGMLFTNFYAIGHRSTDGITASCCSLPTYSDLQIIGTSIEQNRFMCVGDVLGKAGYSSFFLHGAKTGSFGLNAFARVAGFERYIGKEDFDLNPNEVDDTWGVYDHVSLQRLNDELRTVKEPVCALWFSLTTHAPYQLPSDKYKITSSTLPDHDFIDTLVYADEALGQFFRDASKETYFDNTVFVVMADHTNGEILKGTHERQRIPCLIYAPGHIAPKTISEVRSQLDVFPTVVDLAGVRSSYTVLGRSLLASNRNGGFAFADFGEHYGWFQNQFVLLAGPQGEVIGLYDTRNDPYELRNVADSFADTATAMRRDLFAFVQVSKKLVRDNELVPREIQ